MGTRKINFQRFKEGDNFNNRDTFDRFEQFENDLNEDQNGLHNTGIAEGAINHQHLTHDGPLTVTEFSDTPINYGSPILKAECVRNTLTTDSSTSSHVILDPSTTPELTAEPSPGGDPNIGHRLLKRNGMTLGVGSYGVGAGAQHMYISERWHMGTDYKGDADYVPAILLMFNTFITKGCDKIAPSGYTISLWFRDENYLNPDAGYPILGTDRYGYQSPDSVGCHVFEGGSDDPSHARFGDGNTLKDCMPVSIRVLIDLDRLISNTDNFDDSYNPTTGKQTTAENLIVTGLSARVGILGKHSTGRNNHKNRMMFRESSFTALALRGAWAK